MRADPRVASPECPDGMGRLGGFGAAFVAQARQRKNHSVRKQWNDIRSLRLQPDDGKLGYGHYSEYERH